MNFTTYIPTDRLKPFIRLYLIIESRDGLVNRVLPDTSLVMAFRFKGHVSYQANNITKDLPSSVVTGLRKSGRLINYSKESANILVLFKEAVAGALVKEPLFELFGDSVPLDALDDYPDSSHIEEQLSGASTNAQRITLVEQYLLSKLLDYNPDKLISTALNRIRSSRGNIRIKELADSLCISLDAFEKRFRSVVGVSPKQFSFIIRMKSVVNNGLAKNSLTETAVNAGYFDQPHFNKDFKLFTGQTPTEFLKSPVFW